MVYLSMPSKRQTPRTIENARRIVQARGGIIRTSEALGAGIHPRTLYALRDRGVLEQLSRGVYRLTSQQPVSDPDLLIVAVRIPRAVLCLVSALQFHDMTTQVPHRVFVALEKGAEAPRLAYPPLSVHRFSGQSFAAGIEEHGIDGASLRVYSPEKTLADCFKFRNRIGMDIVLEALKLYRRRRRPRLDDLMHYARVCRVANVMRPYLEAVV